MNFELNDEQSVIRERVREFRQTYCDAGRKHAFAGSDTFPDDLYEAMARSGHTEVRLAEGHRGDEAGLTGAALVSEELARASSALVNMYLVNAIFAGGLVAIAGSDEQMYPDSACPGGGRVPTRVRAD
ncbi:MAG: acyl-CoA dehydrogenase family protein [Woeseiaceae bacterium]|nr:acyl-CoA dehydrogenase family protein [Woeseiaceae bacterium]